MAKGHENLIPLNQLTEEERRAMASRAGKASVVARREKKKMRDYAEIFGRMMVDGKAKRTMQDVGVAEEDCTRLMQVTISLFQKALKGDVAAYNAIRDIMGEKPKDEVEQTMETKIEIGYVRTGVEPVNDERDIKI